MGISKGAFLHTAGTAPISKVSHDHPENHPPLGKHTRGKNSRFRRQSGIFSVKQSFI